MSANGATDRDMVAELRTACDAAGGVRAWARANAVSPGTVQDILSGRNDMSEKIGNRLGFVRRPMWFPLQIRRKEASSHG